MSDYLATVIQQARDWDYDRARSQQRQAGWSEMAGCRAKLGFIHRGDWATDDVDEWAAIKGTGLHAWLTEVRRAACQAEGLDMAFDGDPDSEVSYGLIRGHVDEINYSEGVVTDYKFPALKSARFWADPEVLEEKFVQPHGYGAAIIGTRRWIEAAERAGRDPSDCTVQLLVCPVDGIFDDWMLFRQPLDTAVADAAVARYRWVRQASDQGLDLPRDKERYFCETWCEYFTACRGGPRGADDGGLEEILHPEHAAALEAYGLAADRERDARADKEAAAAVIRGMNGHARGWKVTMSRPGKAREEPDMNAIRADYENSGVELPMAVKPGSAPSLSVTRVDPPAKKPRGGKGTAVPSQPLCFYVT